MYPNACWYEAAWSAQKSSLAEFFMRVIEGNVCALVDLHDRTNVKYVFCGDGWDMVQKAIGEKYEP